MTNSSKLKATLLPPAVTRIADRLRAEAEADPTPESVALAINGELRAILDRREALLAARRNAIDVALDEGFDPDRVSSAFSCGLTGEALVAERAARRAGNRI